MTEQEDLSSKTVLALVMLALVISFVGAWVSITAAGTLESSPAPATHGTPDAAGKVTLQIVEKQETQSAGQVTLQIEQTVE